MIKPNDGSQNELYFEITKIFFSIGKIEHNPL